MWKFGVLTAYSLGEQVFQTIGLLLMMLALIVTYFGRNLSFFGYRLLNYFTLWLFYFIALAVLLCFEYKPGAIGFSIFYMGLSIIAIVASGSKVKTLEE